MPPWGIPTVPQAAEHPQNTVNSQDRCLLQEKTGVGRQQDRGHSDECRRQPERRGKTWQPQEPRASVLGVEHTCLTETEEQRLERKCRTNRTSAKLNF